MKPNPETIEKILREFIPHSADYCIKDLAKALVGKLEVKLPDEIIYDKDAGIYVGPFNDCKCPSHHAHSTGGERSCPICTNYNICLSDIKELNKEVWG